MEIYIPFWVIMSLSHILAFILGGCVVLSTGIYLTKSESKKGKHYVKKTNVTSRNGK